MNINRDRLIIDVVDSDERFTALKDEWDALIEQSTNPSIFATYPFVYTAWKHFRSETDRLFILAVRRNGTLVGIAPFRIESMRIGKMPLFRDMHLRILRFIAEWGGGDKPAIVTTEQPGLVWERIFQFLNKEFTQWDGMVLVEQPADSPVPDVGFFRTIHYSTRVIPECTSFFISLAGTWEEYITTRGKSTLRTWRKDHRKMSRLPQGVAIQCFDDPETLPAALKRFITLEQYGWKKKSPFSVGGNEKQKAFYEDLLVTLSQEKMAAIYFLTSGTDDIAGKIIFKSKTTVYSVQITYNHEFADYSPGIILTAEIIKNMFGTQYREFDLLGFRNERKNNAKENWSTGTRKTITIQVYKKSVSSFLNMNGDKVKQLPVKLISVFSGHKILNLITEHGWKFSEFF